MDQPNSGRTPRGSFPDPLIYLPLLEHRQTFIILHGRGSSATKFGPPLLREGESGKRLQDVFPNAKVIFPTASSNRATIYKKSYTNQWFDNWHHEEYTKRQDLMRPGLKKSVEYVHGILRAEIAVVGRENVVLWGLSQGCATALASVLLWKEEPFAAAVGMCGYLPFGNIIKEIASSSSSSTEIGTFSLSEDEDDDPFVDSDDDDGDGSDLFDKFKNENPKDKASKFIIESIAFLSEEIELESEGETDLAFQKIPIFLGHGIEDEKVDVEQGIEAFNALSLLKVNVKMIEYPGLGHWYSEEMLVDIFGFLKEKLSL